MLELVVNIVFLKKEMVIADVLKNYLCGGWGPGSYYYPLMIQFVFVFPIIYFVIKENSRRGLVICLVVNILYEILKWAYEMNIECYRLLLFRYIFIIAFGCYLIFINSIEYIYIYIYIRILVRTNFYCNVSLCRIYTGYSKLLDKDFSCSMSVYFANCDVAFV